MGRGALAKRERSSSRDDDAILDEEQLSKEIAPRIYRQRVEYKEWPNVLRITETALQI